MIPGGMEYVPITDEEAVDALSICPASRIIPAVESAHALAHVMALAPTLDRDAIIVVNLSGRGDKDCAAMARYRGEDIVE